MDFTLWGLHQEDREGAPSGRRRSRRGNFLTSLDSGILLLECSNLSLAENAAVLATSGATTKEGGSIGNSFLYVDLAASFIAQWDDDALMRRDKAPQRRTHRTAAAATPTWDLSSPSSALLEQDTVDGGEWEKALGTCDEPWEDQSWAELEEAAVLDDDWTDELPPMDPELEDHFGSLEAAEAHAVTEFKSASSDMRNATRTFMETKDLVSRVKHAMGYFLVSPTPIASQIQSDINRTCEGRTGTWNSHSTRSVFALSPNGTFGPGLCKSRDA